MRIIYTSVFVDDQDKALRFYTEKLGFAKKRDIDAGEYRWLTVVSPEDPDGTELVLEPNNNPAASTFQRARGAGHSGNELGVSDVQAEYERLQALGDLYHGTDRSHAERIYRCFDDTCGNLIQIQQTPFDEAR